MNCVLCGADISKPEQQFGDVKNPICQSDYLAGQSWIYDEPALVTELKNGASLDEAIKTSIAAEITDLEKFAFELWDFMV